MDIVFDHEKDEVHFGPEQSLALFLFLKEMNGAEDVREMGVDPDGIVCFRGCPGDRETHKIKPCFDEFGHPISPSIPSRW